METKHHTIFSQSECLSEEQMYAYIDNKLSAKEKHMVENHLADCELCSDALEGFMQMSDTSSARFVVAGLKEQLNKIAEKENKPKVIWFDFRMKVAIAAVMLLLIGVTILFNLQKKDSDQKNDDKIFSEKFEPYKTPKETVKDPDGKSFKSGGEKDKQKIVVADNYFHSQQEKFDNPLNEARKGEDFEKTEDKSPDMVKPLILMDNNKKEQPTTDELSKQTDDKSSVAKEKDGDLPFRANDQTNAVVTFSNGNASTYPMGGNNNIQATTVAEKKADLKGNKAKSNRYKESPKLGATKNEETSTKDVEKMQQSPASATGAVTNTELESAMDKYDNNDYTGAIPLFEQTLKTDPDNYDALFFAGVSYLSANNPDKAISCLTKVSGIVKGEFYEASKWYLALAYIKKNKNDAAKILLNDIIQMNGFYKTKATETLKELK